MRLDAVLFDMDGLLLDSEAMWRRAFMQVAPDRPDRESFYPSLIGHRAAVNRAQLTQWLGDSEQADALWQAWGRLAEALMEQGIACKPGAQALLRDLHGRLPMAVVTSSPHAVAERHLRDAGLWPYLDALVGGDDVTHGKPDPEPYLQGAAALGVRPERCAAFEDSLTGVRAAVAAGCVVVQVPDLVPGDPGLGARLAESLGEGARMLGLIG